MDALNLAAQLPWRSRMAVYARALGRSTPDFVSGGAAAMACAWGLGAALPSLGWANAKLAAPALILGVAIPIVFWACWQGPMARAFSPNGARPLRSHACHVLTAILATLLLACHLLTTKPPEALWETQAIVAERRQEAAASQAEKIAWRGSSLDERIDRLEKRARGRDGKAAALPGAIADYSTKIVALDASHRGDGKPAMILRQERRRDEIRLVQESSHVSEEEAKRDITFVLGAAPMAVDEQFLLGHAAIANALALEYPVCAVTLLAVFSTTLLSALSILARRHGWRELYSKMFLGARAGLLRLPGWVAATFSWTFLRLPSLAWGALRASASGWSLAAARFADRSLADTEEELVQLERLVIHAQTGKAKNSSRPRQRL